MLKMFDDFFLVSEGPRSVSMCLLYIIRVPWYKWDPPGPNTNETHGIREAIIFNKQIWRNKIYFKTCFKHGGGIIRHG